MRRLIICFIAIVATLTVAAAAVSPADIANELVEAWTCNDAMPQARFEGLARALQLEVLDVNIVDDEYEDEDGNSVCLNTLTLRAATGYRLSKVVIKDADDEDVELIDYITVENSDVYAALEVVVSRPCDAPDAYNFECSDDSSLRVGFADERTRDSVLDELLKITKMKYDNELDGYRGESPDDEHLGTVIEVIDDFDGGLHWVEIFTL